jgi:hypothetical protein
MPTAAIITFTNLKLEPCQNPHLACVDAVLLGASLNLARGTVLGQKTADGKFYPYVDGNADGTQTARCILAYDVQTDAGGLVTLSATAAQAGGEHAQKYRTAEVYTAGYFKTTDLTGLDAAGITDMGRLISGALADGVLRVY